MKRLMILGALVLAAGCASNPYALPDGEAALPPAPPQQPAPTPPTPPAPVHTASTVNPPAPPVQQPPAPPVALPSATSVALTPAGVTVDTTAALSFPLQLQQGDFSRATIGVALYRNDASRVQLNNGQVLNPPHAQLNPITGQVLTQAERALPVIDMVFLTGQQSLRQNAASRGLALCYWFNGLHSRQRLLPRCDTQLVGDTFYADGQLAANHHQRWLATPEMVLAAREAASALVNDTEAGRAARALAGHFAEPATTTLSNDDLRRHADSVLATTRGLAAFNVTYNAGDSNAWYMDCRPGLFAPTRTPSGRVTFDGLHAYSRDTRVDRNGDNAGDEGSELCIQSWQAFGTDSSCFLLLEEQHVRALVLAVRAIRAANGQNGNTKHARRVGKPGGNLGFAKVRPKPGNKPNLPQPVGKPTSKPAKVNPPAKRK